MILSGFDELNAKPKKISEEMPKARNKIVAQEAENLQKYVKKLTPVDTGHLRDNWHRTRAKGGQATVYNNVEYAAHVEYGHRLFTRKKPKRFIRFVPGKKMLIRGMATLKHNYESDIEAILGAIFKK